MNVSSEGGSIALMNGGRPAYSVSKAALNALTRMLAGELYRDGILVNAVCPGWMPNDGSRPGGRSAFAQGAASVVWAVTLPNGGPTGTFTRDGRELPWYIVARSVRASRRDRGLAERPAARRQARADPVDVGVVRLWCG